jgi:hypothetical protein
MATVICCALLPSFAADNYKIGVVIREVSNGNMLNRPFRSRLVRPRKRQLAVRLKPFLRRFKSGPKLWPETVLGSADADLWMAELKFHVRFSRFARTAAFYLAGAKIAYGQYDVTGGPNFNPALPNSKAERLFPVSWSARNGISPPARHSDSTSTWVTTT